VGSRFVPPPAPDPTPTIHPRRWYSARALGGILEAHPRAFLKARERNELKTRRQSPEQFADLLANGIADIGLPILFVEDLKAQLVLIGRS
jgi:hypothetical protein